MNVCQNFHHQGNLIMGRCKMNKLGNRDHVTVIIEEVANQTPYVYCIYALILIVVVINSLMLFTSIKEMKKVKYILLTTNNFLLTIALLIGCMIHTLMLDVLGMNAYFRLQHVTNNLLILFGISLLLSTTNIIFIITYSILKHNKSKQDSRKQ